MASRGTRLAAHTADDGSTKTRAAKWNPSNPIGCSACLEQDLVLIRVRIKHTYMPDSEYDADWINTEILVCMLMRSLTLTECSCVFTWRF